MRPTLATTLAVLLALPSNAQEAGPRAEAARPDMVETERARLILLPDSTPVEVVGGCWLSTTACVQNGRDMAALRAERDALRESVMRAERERWLLFGLGVGGGALAAWGVPQLLRLLFPPPPPAPAR